MRKKPILNTTISKELNNALENERESTGKTKSEIIEECLSDRYKIRPRTVEEVHQYTGSVKVTAKYFGLTEHRIRQILRESKK